LTGKIYTLSRGEVIRGYGSFERILKNCTKIDAGLVNAFVSKCDARADFRVKVGFLLSKKKLKNLTSATG
jgi:hypothetical protein